MPVATGLGRTQPTALLKAKQLFCCKKNRQRAEAAIQKAQKRAHLDGPQFLGGLTAIGLKGCLERDTRGGRRRQSPLGEVLGNALSVRQSAEKSSKFADAKIMCLSSPRHAQSPSLQAAGDKIIAISLITSASFATSNCCQEKAVGKCFIRESLVEA